MKKLIMFVFLFGIVFCGFSQTDDNTNKELLRTSEKILNVVTQQSDSARAASIRVTTNEFGLDIFDLLIFHVGDITYEHVKNSEFGFGLTVRFGDLYSLGLTEDVYNVKYNITPFVRYYFFNKQDYGAKGFYVEAFLKFFGGKYYGFDGYYDSYSNSYVNAKDKNYLEGALGVGLGYKFVNRSGFIVDLNLGLGRSLGLSNKIGDTVVGRGGIILGYRF